MLNRLLGRAAESTVKRDDDKEDVMLKRIETFENSMSIFGRFVKEGKFQRIPATGSVDEVYKRLEMVLFVEGVI